MVDELKFQNRISLGAVAEEAFYFDQAGNSLVIFDEVNQALDKIAMGETPSTLGEIKGLNYLLSWPDAPEGSFDLSGTNAFIDETRGVALFRLGGELVYQVANEQPDGSMIFTDVDGKKIISEGLLPENDITAINSRNRLDSLVVNGTAAAKEARVDRLSKDILDSVPLSPEQQSLALNLGRADTTPDPAVDIFPDWRNGMFYTHNDGVDAPQGNIQKVEYRYNAGENVVEYRAGDETRYDKVPLGSTIDKAYAPIQGIENLPAGTQPENVEVIDSKGPRSDLGQDRSMAALVPDSLLFAFEGIKQQTAAVQDAGTGKSASTGQSRSA
jgi:hypothetical protein